MVVEPWCAMAIWNGKLGISKCWVALEVVMDHVRNVSFTIQLSSLKFYKIRVGFLNYLN